MIKKDNGLFSYYYKHKIKKTFIDIIILYLLGLLYMVYDGRGSDITLMSLLEILLLAVGGAILFTVFICTIKVLTSHTFEYDLIACKWHYEVENGLANVSDDVIIKYIRNKYNFLVISISSVLALTIFDKHTLNLEYLIKAFVIYIILRSIFLNKKLIKKNKLFIKYREFFPYQERGIEEIKTDIKSKVNTITLFILIMITTELGVDSSYYPYNRIYAGITLIIYFIIITNLSKIVDRFYK